MSEPQQPEDNPYLATQVADIARTAGDRKAPGPVATFISAKPALYTVSEKTSCAAT